MSYRNGKKGKKVNKQCSKNEEEKLKKKQEGE